MATLVMTPFDSFLPEVLPYAPNCPELIAVNAIRNACIEFCEKTWFWQHDCTPQTGALNVSEYTPDVPTDTHLVGVINAWYDGQMMFPEDNATLRRKFPYSDYRDATGQPKFWQHTDPDTMLIVPKPDANSAGMLLTMRVAVAPVRASTDVNAQIHERYVELIAQGALARLKATGGQPYSDPTGAVLLDRMFKSECVKVRADVERSLTRGPLRVRFNGRNA
jgi:hypothetical protein